MKPEVRRKLIEENDEHLLGGYGAHVRARNAAPADRLAQQIKLAALAELQHAPAPRRSNLDWLFGTRRGYALAGALAILAIFLTAYILTGGRPSTPDIVANASASDAQISAQHNGLFGLSWYLPLGLDASNTAALTQGDEIETGPSTQVTLTFQSGTQVRINPNSVVRIASLSPLRVVLRHGEVVNLVQPAAVAGIPALQVLSERGEYTAHGTVYVVRVAGSGDHVKTREGDVGARTARAEQNVAKGEEADITSSGLITRYLSAPEVTLELPAAPMTHDGESIATNAHAGTLKISTAANARVDAALTTSDQVVTMLPSVLANPQGEATLQLKLPRFDTIATLVITATDTSADQLGSTLSRPITITVDRTPPMHFRLSEPVDLHVSASPVRIVGVTEANTRMTINGVVVAVTANGAFSADVPVVQGDNRVEIIITDNAGNTLRVMQTVVLK